MDNSLLCSFNMNIRDNTYRVDVYMISESRRPESMFKVGSCSPSCFTKRFKSILSYPCISVEHLKPIRNSWANRIKKNLKDRIDSASWAITGKTEEIGASIP